MMLGAALAYVARGWPVVPLHWPTTAAGPSATCSCADPACASIAKHPIADLVRHGLRDASTDADRVRTWWRAFPEANIALVLGHRAGLFALDVDPRPSKRTPTAPTGDVALVQLVAEHGHWPETLRAWTGGGGDHYFFRLPAGAQLRGKLCPGLDVKGEGGYVVAPPSRHASGRRYRWLSRVEPIEPPAWLLQLATAEPVPRAPSTSSSSTSFPTSTRTDLRERAERYLDAMPPAISGQGGHDATMRAAVALVQGFELAPEMALELLVRVFNPRCDPPWPRKDLEHKVRSAMRARRVGRGWLVNASRRSAA